MHGLTRGFPLKSCLKQKASKILGMAPGAISCTQRIYHPVREEVN